MEKDNRGAIWGNQKKQKDTHPDFTGNAMVDGVDLTFSFEKAQIDIEEQGDADNL